MAIAVDSTSSGYVTSADSGTSFNVSHTCTGSNLVLVVIVSQTDGVGTNPSVTYNGVAMTLVDSIDSSMASFIFALVNPATGTHNITVTKAASTNVAAANVSFNGAGGYSAHSAASANNASAASVTVNTATTGNGYVAAGAIANDVGITMTYAGSGTQFVNTDTGPQIFTGAYTYFASGADVTESWTHGSTKWAITGIEVYELATDTGGMFFML